WMGWPVGVEYAESSNVENAGKLKGKLLLLNGEMDYNVDPSSTAQLVNALIRAGKDFEYVLLPGAGHSSGGVYGERKRRDFFVRNLLGLDPPDWNMLEK
ncbi:MAG: prolyl oligopeptidase family serine peptidase, partial [Bacteroidales bacterium]|nr:prolyl oligopeptidase family serine peptidase [Bacteroidales bacterium]